MMITDTQSLYEITTNHPETLELLVRSGFPQLRDPEKRETFGKRLTLATAAKLKGLDPLQLAEQLNALTSGEDTGSKADLWMAGLLPCPVKLPLQEGLDRSLEACRRNGLSVRTDLQSANMGTAFIEEHILSAETEEDLPDLFISAGFDLFFSGSESGSENDPLEGAAKGLGRFRKEGVFSAPFQLSGNPTFKGLELNDPTGCYSMIAVVPAVFMVNHEELGDRKVPRTWRELLSPEFEGSVSLPIGDFDLFNALMVTLADTYGEDILPALARSLHSSLHPSQMVKHNKLQGTKPCVSIMPYFFSKMTREGGPLELVWPEDGAVISPIFLLTKGSKLKELQPLTDFFGSAETAELLAIRGLFPSLHPEAENPVPEGSPFLWAGWELLLNNDISERIQRYQHLFDSHLLEAAV